MSKKKKKTSADNAPKIHPRNKHQGRYDFEALTTCFPTLKEHVILNIHQNQSIDFSNPESVKVLNAALLAYHYQIQNWDIPAGYLTPPVPGRADYIHHMADLLCTHNYGKIPTGDHIKMLDVGVGASCIYPIIANAAYGWSAIGSDINQGAIESSQKILDNNPNLKEKITLKHQPNSKDTIYGILKKEDKVDLMVCNPPFHGSAEEAKAGSARKVSNLQNKKIKEPVLNFGGQNHELWCVGGERKFIYDLIRQSKKFPQSCYWFSTLVSKSTNLKSIHNALDKYGATANETIPMGQGNKASRLVAWTFLTKEEQKQWKNTRWKVKSDK